MIARLMTLILSLASVSCATSSSPATYTPTVSEIGVIERYDVTTASGDVPVRITWPKEGRRLPVVVFSHGAFSSREWYLAITDRWAAAGYLVISPTHIDSTTRSGRRGVPPDPAWWTRRLEDVQAIVRDLPTLVRSVPGLADRVDSRNLVMTGHSFGGMVAQTVGGATWFDPDRNVTVSNAVENVRAVVILSGAGRLPPRVRDSDWSTLRVPTFVSVGTNDLKQTEISGLAWRSEPYEFAPPGDKYLLTIEGADHYLGGTIGRDDIARDPRGERYVAAFALTSIAFMDGYVKGNRAALRWLQAEAKRERLDVEPLATLRSK